MQSDHRIDNAPRDGNGASAADLEPVAALDALYVASRDHNGGRLRSTLWIIIAVGLLIHLACLILGKTLFRDFSWPHHPVHAAIETGGAMIALWVAWILMMLQRRGLGTSFNVWIAGALIGMGLLDGLHALVHVGQEFVWLHSMATFVGGLLFSAVWLPRKLQKRVVSWWPLSVATAVMLFGFVSIALPDYTPRMLVINDQGQKFFTIWAQGLNVSGGMLMFSAATRMFLVWRKLQNVDDLLFILQCVLFGAAAVMFEQSQLWDVAWWGWHVLRLLAYGVALWFVVLSEQRSSAELRRRALEMSKLSAIVEASDEAIHSRNLEGKIISWNHGAEHMFGYSAAEMTSDKRTAFIPADRMEELNQILGRLRKGNHAERLETVRIHRDGRSIDVALTISPIHDSTGRVTGTATIARDITERKRLEQLQQQVLDQSRAELEFAYASSGSVDLDDDSSDIVNIRPNGQAGFESFDHAMYFWARQARSIIGAHQSAVSFIPNGNFGDGRHAVSMSEKYKKYNHYDVPPTGKGIWSLVASENLSFCMTDAELKQHPAWKNFSNLQDARGLEHPPMRGWLAVPVLSQDQQFMGVVQLSDKYCGDFTPADLQRLTRLAQLLAPAFCLHAANEEMRLRSAELAEKNIELERQRKNAIALAEELQLADKAKNEFLANMSHEIRTPMNAVICLTELVLHSSLNESQRDYLRTVMDSAESLLAVINDILDFSKIEAGMLQFEAVNFNMQDHVSDTVRAQALRAEEKGLELACFVDPQIPNLLTGDPGRLRQVITNLVGNAIKFTHEGEVVVRVEILSREQDRLRLRFSVTDTGMGIAEGKRELIFKPFEQADTSTTREFGGTGLGLTICQRLVSLMGGRLEVESEVGRGSKFHFIAEYSVSTEATPPQPVPTELEGMRVLIVDDNATNRTILEQILLAKHMTPVTAASAMEGYNLLQDALNSGRPFRLLISDVHMPRVDGFEFAQLIRANLKLSGLEIIHLTSAGQQDDQQRGMELRIAAQLTKPVRQSELYNVIIRALGMGERSEDGWMTLPVRTNGDLPRLHVLLVEDSLVNQKVAFALLTKSGHSIEIANNGQEALEHLSQQKFDVVLMDIQMPVMDGMEATAAIRKMEEGTERHQPIVAMTAHAMSGDRERCLAAGMDEYVSKPVRREALFRAITIALGLQNSSDVATSEVTMPNKGRIETESNLVDWNAAQSQVGGDMADLREITESYIQEIGENLTRLAAAISADNARESKRMAHSVKGAMRFFHAEAAKAVGLELENLAGSGDLKNAGDLLPQLRQEVDRVLKVLQHFIDTGEMK